MPSQEEIDQQLAMLAAHRRTLAHLLQQAAVFGSIASVPPEVRTGIDDARAQIRHIKTMLRAWGIEVADHPDDGDLPGSHDPILSTPPMSLSIFVAIIIFLGTIVAGFFSSLLTRSPAPSSVIPTGVASNLRPTAVLPMITPTPPLSLSPTVSGQVEITYPSAMVLEEPDVVTVQIIALQPLTPMGALLPIATGVISIEARTRDNRRLTAHEKIRLYPVMSAELSAQKFKIDPGEKDTRRLIAPGQPAVWTWTISPEEIGDEVPLTFKVFGEISLNGEKYTILAVSITRNVKVADKAWPKKAWDGVTKNAMGIVGTSGPIGLLLALLGYWQGSKKLKDRVENLEKTIEEMKKAATPQPEPREKEKAGAPQPETDAPPRPSKGRPKGK